MKIQIKYFAQLRDQAKVSSEFKETQASNPRELYIELSQQYNFQLELGHLQVAINDEFADFNQPLKEGDLVVFIPPVAGG